MCRASFVAQTVKCLPAMWETRVQFLRREDPLEKEMAIHSSTLAWKIPWTRPFLNIKFRSLLFCVYIFFLASVLAVVFLSQLDSDTATLLLVITFSVFAHFPGVGCSCHSMEIPSVRPPVSLLMADPPHLLFNSIVL